MCLEDGSIYGLYLLLLTRPLHSGHTLREEDLLVPIREYPLKVLLWVLIADIGDPLAYQFNSSGDILLWFHELIDSVQIVHFADIL